MGKPLVLVVGAGPGVGAAVARRFAQEGYAVALVGRDPAALADLATDVALGVGALLTAVQAARPFMSRGARVTATGSMAADKPWNEAASLGVQKAGLRNLVHSLDTTLAPDGIRAVSVTVRGVLAREGTFTPERVAEAVFAAATQDEAGWRTEVPYPQV